MIPMKSKKRMMIPIDYLYDTQYEVGSSLLKHLFDQCTLWNSANLFASVYIPVKMVTASGMAADYSYINVGMSTTEIATLYWQKYGGMSLLGNYVGKDEDEQFTAILNAFTAVFKANLGKYLKWMEANGYEYNPLWNVDGTEIRQELENHGESDTAYGGVTSDQGNDFTAFSQSHDVSGFNSPEMRHDSKDITEGLIDNAIGQTHQEVKYDAQTGSYEVLDGTAPTNASASHSRSSGQKSLTSTIHRSAKNIVDGSEVEYAVAASDTAFGTALIGGDRMHIEKYVRQGNIGVTKTTELIQAQRDMLRFSLIQEFFDDVNAPNLIGIYNF